MRLLCCILLLPLSSLGQASGYMGKKAVFKYNLHFFSAFTNPNANGVFGATSFNTQHHFTGEYVLNRKNAIGASVRFYNTSTDFDYPLEYTNTTDPFSNNTFLITPTEIAPISAVHIGLVWKGYFKYLAPVGPYNQIEFGLSSATIDPPESMFTYDNTSSFQQDEYKAFALNASPYNNLYLAYKFGYQHILFDLLIVDYGLQLGCVFTGVETLFDTQPTNENYFEFHTNKRITNHNLINVSLGIGCIPF